jgi:hypothetical protein
MTNNTPNTPAKMKAGEAQPLFNSMLEGYYAKIRAGFEIEKILGWEWDSIAGVGFDHYDESFEIYAPEECVDAAPTLEQHQAIMALGCQQYWINFADGTERFCRGERKQGNSRWRKYDEGERLERRAALAQQQAQPVLAPQAMPLTDEQIGSATAGLYVMDFQDENSYDIAVARAIEAAHGIGSDTKAAAVVSEDARMLDWLAANPGIELDWGEPEGGIEDDEYVWRVYKVGGSRNDRAWHFKGQGSTPREAIRAAMSADGAIAAPGVGEL